MPAKRKTTKIGKQKRAMKAMKHGEAKRHEGQSTAKSTGIERYRRDRGAAVLTAERPVPVATKPAHQPPNPNGRQNFFRLTDPHVRKIGHGSNGFLPKYRRAG